LEQFEKMGGGIDGHIRLLAADDTAAELLRSLVEDQNAELPVALIESHRMVVIPYKGTFYDIGLAIATKMGLPLAGPTGPRLAAGWSLGPREGKWELTDPTGTLVARCEVVTRDAAREPAWTAQAMTVGQMLVAYGSEVGVRVPDGVQTSRYYDGAATQELRQSLGSRRACLAVVGLSLQIQAFRVAGRNA
jgi:hypothetical protein